MNLREKTIELIRENGLNMRRFGALSDQLPECGTVCCIAGNICIAAEQLGLELPSEEEVDSVSGELKCDSTEKTPRTARALWARYYGIQEADNLGFYDEEWGYHIGIVTPEMAIANLNGHRTPFDHDCYNSDRIEAGDLSTDGIVEEFYECFKGKLSDSEMKKFMDENYSEELHLG